MNLWIEATRPKTWIASISPVLIGTLSSPKIDWWIFSITLLCGLFIQIGTNLANDYYDCIQGRDTPLRQGPRRLCQTGLINPRHMFLFMCSIFAVGFFFSLLLMVRGGAIIFWMYVLATILGLFYTKGPINYAYRGVSEPIVLFFLGSLAVFFTAYLQTLKFDLNLLVIGLAPGFFSVALLAINNLRDYEEDCLTKKNTLVVRFGKVFGKIEVTLSILLPFIILWSSVNLLLTPFLIVIIYQLWTSRNIPRLLPKVAACFILFNVTFIIKTVFGC